MISVRNANNRIIPSLIFLSILAVGSQETHATLLDGMLDTVEEALAKGLAEKNERLTTGNFYTDARPNAHGPIGMMGEHTHEAGEVMFSYRLMHMWMQGTRYGDSRISNENVLGVGPVPGGYVVVPESMRMIMHMFGFMYGLNDTVTLTAMIPYIHLNMNHRVRSSTGNAPPPPGVRGEKFTTRSEGVGDIRFGSLWRLWAVEAPSIGAHRFHMNLAISVPTGRIEPVDHTPLSKFLAGTGSDPNARLPYPMHLGSGTFDWYPGITYGGEKGRAAWGAQIVGTLRMGRNSSDFSKGDAYMANLHGSYEVIKAWLSGSVRLSWNHWEPYDGADPAITTHAPFDPQPRLVQTAFPDLLGGQRLDILGGINVLFPEIMGMENRLAVEGGVPVYQYLDGQLETDSIITFGWQGLY